MFPNRYLEDQNTLVPAERMEILAFQSKYINSQEASETRYCQLFQQQLVPRTQQYPTPSRSLPSLRLLQQ